MPYAALKSVELYYEISGPEDGEPLVMVHGLGAQMIAWYPGLVEEIEKRGFKTIRFDNRDIGLSGKMDQSPDYALRDMSEDVFQLIQHLGLGSAHVAGQSMGGMIVQQLAIDHPEAVRSLNIIYSTPDRNHMTGDEDAWEVRHRPAAPDREGLIQQYIDREHISGMDGFSEEWIREFATQVHDRNYCPEPHPCRYP